MTYDELYEHIVAYVAQPLDDKRKACLILGAFMEFIMDCDDAGIDVNKIDLTNFVGEKLDELEDLKYNNVPEDADPWNLRGRQPMQPVKKQQ